MAIINAFPMAVNIDLIRFEHKITFAPNQSIAIEGTNYGLAGESTITKIGSQAFDFLYDGSMGYSSNTNIYHGTYLLLTKAVFNNVTLIDTQAFYQQSYIQEIDFPQCISIRTSAFQNCWALSKVHLPLVQSIGSSAFKSCSALVNISLPCATYIGYGAFESCITLAQISLPACQTISTVAFARCNKLSIISLPVCNTIGKNAFTNCSSLAAIYLLSNSMVTLKSSATVVFNYTPIMVSSYLGYYGSIYVPASLYNTYKANTSWAGISARFVSI